MPILLPHESTWCVSAVIHCQTGVAHALIYWWAGLPQLAGRMDHRFANVGYGVDIGFHKGVNKGGYKEVAAIYIYIDIYIYIYIIYILYIIYIYIYILYILYIYLEKRDHWMLWNSYGFWAAKSWRLWRMGKKVRSSFLKINPMNGHLLSDHGV